MSFKTRIKNDYWRVNYIIPFVKRHQFDERGKIDMLKHVFHAYRTIKPVKVKGRVTSGTLTKAIFSCVDINLDNSSRFVYFIDCAKTIAIPGNILSNFTLDYNKIIHGRFDDLVDKAKGTDEYGREAQLVAEGIEIIRARIESALVMSDHSNKERLIEYFSRMLNTPACHFEEGLQRILFFNQSLWQTRHRLNGLGRLDLILDDLYMKDINDGLISREIAIDMIADFLNALSLYPDYKSDALEGDIGQIIVLGGLNSDGTYFCNELTNLFLQEHSKISKPDPKVLLRVSEKMPRNLLGESVNCLLAKTGSPLFSNDDVVIPALLDFEVAKEDAYNYCVSACWEPLVVGKSLAQNNIAVFDYFSSLDEVLSIIESDCFDNLVERYIDLNQKRFQGFLDELNKIKWAKDPLVSLFSEESLNSRVDISEGGCKYNNYGVTTVALPNVIDSLFFIKKYVYEEKKTTLRDLNEKRKKDYQDNEELYNQIKSGVRYFGHDNEEIISLTNRIEKSIESIAIKYRNPLGGTVKYGLSSPGYNILSKKTTGDFSGRKAGMPYNTHISCVDAAYTELVNFAGRLDYNGQKFNGNVVDFFVTPDFISKNKDRFVTFLNGAIGAGFFQMQMNVLDSKTLIAAKSNPENYNGLIVRVWGFSAYFRDLPDSYKDLLIERAIAAEKV